MKNHSLEECPEIVTDAPLDAMSISVDTGNAGLGSLVAKATSPIP